MGFDKGGMDAVFLHVLEAIGAISKFWNYECEEELDAAKCRIFWKTLRGIANLEIGEGLVEVEDEDEQDDDDDDQGVENIALKEVLNDFPDNEKEKDGRMWMPMHFAVSVPDIRIEDIDLLFAHHPESIKQGCRRGDNLTPCHLAVMAREPNMALIERLKKYDPSFARSLTGKSSSPLHLAAQYSNSVDLIDELIEMYPEALHIRDRRRCTPLKCCLSNHTQSAPDILQVIVDAATPQTASQTASQIVFLHRGFLPLHFFLEKCRTISETAKERMVPILLRAFPNDVNIIDDNDNMAINLAARNCDVAVFKLIVKAIPASSLLDSSVAHFAVIGKKLNNLRYLRSLRPELPELFFEDNGGKTPLHFAIENSTIFKVDFSFIQAVATISPPDAVRILDWDGNNMLHTLIHQCTPYQLNNAAAWDTLRFLLRLIPGAAVTTNEHGQTPYDLLDSNRPDLIFARRLLLLAGAPSLHPETLKQMNYEARKGGLLAFFGARGEDHSSSGRVDICYRIRYGAGAMELIRQVVSFL